MGNHALNLGGTYLHDTRNYCRKINLRSGEGESNCDVDNVRYRTARIREVGGRLTSVIEIAGRPLLVKHLRFSLRPNAHARNRIGLNSIIAQPLISVIRLIPSRLPQIFVIAEPMNATTGAFRAPLSGSAEICGTTFRQATTTSAVGVCKRNGALGGI